MNNILIVILFSLALLPGLAGAFLPIPGLLYMFIISLIYGFVDKFTHITWWELLILGILTLFAVLNDYFTGMLGAKYGGAASRSMLFGIIGTIIGVILFPPFGGLVGVFLGIMIGELIRHGNKEKALKAATGGFLGSVVGMVITLILAVVFLFLFVIFGIK